MFDFKMMVAGVSALTMVGSSVYAEVGSVTNINSGATSRLNLPVTHQPVQSPDWVLQAQTSVSQREFQHECFSMHKIVKVAVSYFRAADERHKVAYEELWYHNGKALGIARGRQLEIPAGQQIAVQVLESPAAYDPEHKAAANAIMRLVLNILIQHDKVSYVKVPDWSYWFVLQELTNRNAQTATTMEAVPARAKIVFQLVSEQSGQKQIVYFQ